MNKVLLLLPLLLQLTNTSAAQAQSKSVHYRDAGTESLSFEPFASNAGIVGLNYGIGAQEYPVISDIYKGSPADKAGLKVGDEIMAVGDDDTSDTRYTGYLHLQSLLTGKSGAQVKLKVRHASGAEQIVNITRASVGSFKDPNLRKYDVAQWRGHTETTKSVPVTAPDHMPDLGPNHLRDHMSDRGPDHLPAHPAEHFTDHLIDLPFGLLSREHNRPTLFEFTDKESDPGVLDLLKKHSDGSYILSQCKVVRITRADAGYVPLKKYLALSGSYALIPVYQPWLVTVKASDVITALPTEPQVNTIAKTLVHNSIKVQVSHAVARQKGDPGQKLNKRAGLSHKTVFKRFCQTLPADYGIVGLGFAAGSGGYATITQVFAGGPAAKAGLKAGDQIIELNGQDTRYLGLEHIQAALTGRLDHTVDLQINSTDSDISTDKKTDKSNSKSKSSCNSKNISLRYEAVSTFHNQGLAKITISRWKQVISSNTDDSDEYELPCCMLARAKDKPTVFEFCSSASAPGLKATIEKLKGARKLPSAEQDLQLISYSPEDRDFETLRTYFKIKSSYACLPLYCRTKHKTFKANQIIFELPNAHCDQDMALLVEKLMPEQLSKSAKDEANSVRYIYVPAK